MVSKFNVQALLNSLLPGKDFGITFKANYYWFLSGDKTRDITVDTDPEIHQGLAGQLSSVGSFIYHVHYYNVCNLKWDDWQSAGLGWIACKAHSECKICYCWGSRDTSPGKLWKFMLLRLNLEVENYEAVNAFCPLSVSEVK